MAQLQTARSFLFAPGSEERKLARALASGADGEMIDLPVVERARLLLSDEKRSVLHAE